ncbi:DUF350 domain-containing protein [Brevibacillus humidisoli]|uniref:DUF350 domain-containing protein n=1 Tax=Brevibacillus humidisoli TaxID=2895522 RepID=UPI001E5C01C0|nr:DUF350 domain-containing protein [Brevibacillus humidisoli]UFJ42723.1 DUF350 domain-containing protein [Brevibacillus humidisoli]
MAAFLLYSFVGFILLVVSIFLIPLVTPHNEWRLIKQKNRASVIVFGGQIYAISNNLYSAIANSVSIPDFLLFGAVAVLWQIVLFLLVEWIAAKVFYKQRFSRLIEAGEIEPALLFAVFAIAVSNVISPSLIW